jgi:phosphomannomutase
MLTLPPRMVIEINPKAFKSYDIRGIFPEEVDAELAYRVGKAFVVFLQAKQIVVGHDMRVSSPVLAEALLRGIQDQGADVLTIGLCTNPLLHFAVASKKIAGGVMITGSHNPPEYNGLKLIAFPNLQLGKPGGLDEIQRLVEENNFPPAQKGNKVQLSILDTYVAHLLTGVKIDKKLTIVADYGNGAGSITALPVLKELGVKTFHLYAEPDGRFPNHPADPHHLENLQALQQKVKSTQADIGLFFDGDADRVLIVDEQGTIILSDILLALLAKEALLNNPGEKVYYDLRFSRAVHEVIEECGGIPEMLRVGTPCYKEKLTKEGGIIAGEFSGHVMFKEHYGIDDGLYAALKVMTIISKYKVPLSQLIAPLRRYYSSPEINFRVRNAEEVILKVQQKFQDGEVNTLDGLLISYPTWWFSIRKSNTEPLVRLRIEANGKKLLEEKEAELLEIISENGA